MNKIIIAIDGYSACGKSTTAKLVAAAAGYAYVDTGAMYRAVTLYFEEHFVNTGSPRAIEKALEEIHISFHRNEKTGANETWLNGLNVENQIRTLAISNRASEISALHEVRVAMVAQQQKMGKKRGLVMDGRDIGTNVFPDAELKIFMQADMMVRATRRQQELLEKGQLVSLEEVIANIAQRDLQDTTRKENPLRQAEDAYLLDTTRLQIPEQVNMVMQLLQERISK